MVASGTLVSLFTALRNAQAFEAKDDHTEGRAFTIVSNIFEVLAETLQSPELFGYTSEQLREVARQSAAREIRIAVRRYRNEANPPHELYQQRISHMLVIGETFGFSDVDKVMCTTVLAEIDSFVR